MLPRIPLVKQPEYFVEFSDAGKQLANLHINYEKVKPNTNINISGIEKGNFLVNKMIFAKKDGEIDKTTIHYNSDISISNIPLEAYDYILNGKSAIEWIMEGYRVKPDKQTGIIQNPNDFAKEHGDPRYILDLLPRIITVSLETMKIIKGLPKLTF
jgi:predicted helicase